tara:strand:- start:687 stop:1982 length:1296 start_codon:yes stop_codon:yes gene_type:complete
MATHDYVIDNSTGANVRADINNVLAAIVSNNSSSSEPSTKYAYQWWADTNENVLKIRNSANNGWVTLLQLDGTLTLEDGSASAPALGFRDDLDTGIFSSAANNLDIATGGSVRANVSSTGLNVTGTVTDDGATHDGDVTFTGASANVVFDKSDNALEFADNVKAEFGTGGDLEIFHDATDSYLQNTTGTLRINNDGTDLVISTDNNIHIRTNGTEEAVKAIANGTVELYHNNVKKFETTTNGISITGDLRLADNEEIYLGNNTDFQLKHDPSVGNIIKSAFCNLVINDTSGTTGAIFKNSGAVELNHNGSKKFETASGGVSLTGGAAANITALSDASTITVDFATACHHSVTLGGNRTLSGTNSGSHVGQAGSIFITQDGTGSRTLAYDSAYKFAGGTAPTLSTAANAIDRLDYIIKASGVIQAVLTLDVK